MTDTIWYLTELKTKSNHKDADALEEGTLSVEISAENVPVSRTNSSYEMFLETLVERTKEEFKNL